MKIKDLKKLFSEIQSPSKLEEIIRSFYEKMAKDPLIGFFFFERDLNSIIFQQKTFLLRAMGESVVYKGKPPGRAHAKIPPILKGHFDRRIVLLCETLKEYGLSDEAREIWVSFEEQFRKAIVEEEGPLSKRKVLQ